MDVLQTVKYAGAVMRGPVDLPASRKVVMAENVNGVAQLSYDSVAGVLGYTPANVAGDTFTGAVNINAQTIITAQNTNQTFIVRTNSGAVTNLQEWRDNVANIPITATTTGFNFASGSSLNWAGTSTPSISKDATTGDLSLSAWGAKVLRVNSASVAINNACDYSIAVLARASATNQLPFAARPLNASQTTNIFEIQNAGGTSVASFDKTGNLIAVAGTFTGDLITSGKFGHSNDSGIEFVSDGGGGANVGNRTSVPYTPMLKIHNGSFGHQRGLTLGADGGLAWGTANSTAGTSVDITLLRSATASLRLLVPTTSVTGSIGPSHFHITDNATSTLHMRLSTSDNRITSNVALSLSGGNVAAPHVTIGTTGVVTIGDGATTNNHGSLVIKNTSKDILTVDNTSDGKLIMRASGIHGQTLALIPRESSTGATQLIATGASFLEIVSSGAVTIRGDTTIRNSANTLDGTLSAGTLTSNGRIYAYQGTAGAPNYTFLNGNDTGMSQGSATAGSRSLVFSTDGVAALTLGGSGTNRQATFVGSLAVGGNIDATSGSMTIGSGGYYGWSGRTKLDSPSNGLFTLSNNAKTTQVNLRFTTNNLLEVLDAAASASGDLKAGVITANTRFYTDDIRPLSGSTVTFNATQVSVTGLLEAGGTFRSMGAADLRASATLRGSLEQRDSSTGSVGYIQTATAEGVIKYTIISSGANAGVSFDINTDSLLKIRNRANSADANVQTKGTKLRSGASDPTISDIDTDMSTMWKNTTNGEIRMWVNDGGIMRKSVALT